MLPLIYFSTGEANEQGYPFGLSFVTHRTSEKTKGMILSLFNSSYLMTKEECAKEAKYLTLEFVQKIVHELSGQKPLIIVGDENSAELTEFKGDEVEINDFIETHSKMQDSQLNQEITDAKENLHTIQQAGDPLKLHKSAHIQQVKDKFKESYTDEATFEVMLIDDSKFDPISSDEDMNITFSWLDSKKAIHESSKEVLEKGAVHIALTEYAYNLLDAKDNPFGADLLKDLGAIHYILLTEPRCDHVDKLLEKFHAHYQNQLNPTQREELTYAEDIYTGLAFEAEALIKKRR